MNKNDKAGIREVRDLIDKLDDEKITPMQNNISTLIEKLSNFITVADDRHTDYLGKFKVNNEEHGFFISRRLFVTISVILGILFTMINLVQYFVR